MTHISETKQEPVSLCVSWTKLCSGVINETCKLVSLIYSSNGKESACNAGDPGSIPGSGRSAGEGKGYPLQYSGLEDSTDCIVTGLQRVGHD